MLKPIPYCLKLSRGENSRTIDARKLKGPRKMSKMMEKGVKIENFRKLWGARRDAKSLGARKIEARKLKARKFKGRENLRK